MRLAWLVGFVGGLGCAAATPVERKAADPLVEAGSSEAGQQDGSEPSGQNTPGQPAPRRTMGGNNTPGPDGGSIIKLAWLVPCDGAQCTIIFQMGLSSNGAIVRHGQFVLHVMWVAPSDLLDGAQHRLLVSRRGGSQALVLDMTEIRRDDGPWRRYLANLNLSDAAFLAAGDGLRFDMGPLWAEPNPDESAKIRIFTARLVQMIDLEDRLAAAERNQPPVHDRRWQCYRIDTVNESFARCERTREACKLTLEHLVKDQIGAKSSGCLAQPRAACHTAFSKLDRKTRQECAPSFDDCDESRRFFLSQKADWEKVTGCEGTEWSPPE